MIEAYAVGIDIGGTGIKIGLVDITKGELKGDRIRVATPHGAKPQDVIEVVKRLHHRLIDGNESFPVGIGFPSKIINGECRTAVNVSNSWKGMNLKGIFSDAFGQDVQVANDADVAGLAEFTFGDSKMPDHDKALFLTIGTGIGSALFCHGKLFYNTELGLLDYRGDYIERYTSNKVRKVYNLSWKKWGRRLNKALHHYERILTPDIIVLGGGVSKKFEKYEKHIEIDTPVKPASLQNSAGVIGAALLTV